MSRHYCIAHQHIELTGDGTCPECESENRAVIEATAQINRVRNTPLVAACRYNDGVADRTDGVMAAFAELGIPDAETIQHVSMQRVLRAYPDMPHPVQTMLAALLLDGIAIGWTARGFGGEVPADLCVPPVTVAEVIAFTRKMTGK